MITSKIYAIEGIDGCGKSTLIRNLLNSQSAPFYRPIVVRELSATDAGRRAAEWVHTHDITENKMAASEALKYLSEARDAAIAEVVLPHIKNGGCVFFDRFVTTTWVYQNFKPEWGLAELIQRKFHEWSKQFSVFSTVFLDITPTEVARRMGERASTGGVVDPNDRKSADYYQQLREHFISALTTPGVIPYELLGTLVFMHIDETSTPSEVLNKTLKELLDVSEVPSA